MNKKNLRLHIIMAIVMIIITFSGIASIASSPSTSTSSSNMTAEGGTTAVTQQSQQPVLNWTGNGGKGMSIAILAPQANGLEENQSYLPALVQGEFVSNFSGYSAISVLDRERLESQYMELFSGYYDDNAQETMDLGRLTPTTHIMGGNITRTATGYALQMQITKSSDKMTTASYSGTFSFAELDNLTGIRRASFDLLQKMGITLTASAQRELTGAATLNHANAQTALARGVTAQSQGTEVAALSYYFMAAAYDPSLIEAASRTSILNTNISSGNIGMDVRNDIAWRRQWVARLTETEQFFDSFNRTEFMPYTLFYVSNEIKRVGGIDYQRETITLSIETHLHGSGIWTNSIERALQAVYDGLIATGRARDWGLANWPRQGVTTLNAFASRSNSFSVVFELLNDQNKVISRQTLQSGGNWGLSQSWSGGRPSISVSADTRTTFNFTNVNANDISDRMTIRIASVNGTDAETAARNGVLQMRAITRSEFDKNSRYNFSRGTLLGFTNNAARDVEIVVVPERFDRRTYQTIPEERKLIIPNMILGDPVISIGQNAFRDIRLTDIVIPNSVTSIGASAFRDNRLTAINIPDSVTSIGDEAFLKHKTTSGDNSRINSIKIGSNVNISANAFKYSYNYYSDGERYQGEDNSFLALYNNGKKAGIYNYSIVNNLGDRFLSSITLGFAGDSNKWSYTPK